MTLCAFKKIMRKLTDLTLGDASEKNFPTGSFEIVFWGVKSVKSVKCVRIKGKVRDHVGDG
ncbi:MAG: hypothetical protein WAV38_28520, partial [Xanthobacteraceae bacterium]